LHAKNISWVQSPYFSFVVSDYFAQRDTAEFELSSDSHVLFDARVGFALKWKKQLVEVNLGVTNLLNTPYYNHLSLIRTIFVREMGRDIFINLRFPFGIKGNS
jgi:outer membrane receptor protein involved in Fe transport